MRRMPLSGTRITRKLKADFYHLTYLETFDRIRSAAISPLVLWN
jgi:hypothetical protein